MGVKAPWPNSTKEEDRLYEAGLSLGGAEWEHEVADFMGPYGRDALSWKKSKYVGGQSLNLHGTYIGPEYDTDPGYKKAVDERYGSWFKKSGVDIEADMTYTVGEKATNPRVQGHEFLHRNDREIGEYNNRFYNVWRARNDKEYWEALKLFHDDYGSSRGIEATEERLKDNIIYYGFGYKFAEMEADAAKNNKVPYSIPLKQSKYFDPPGEMFDIEGPLKEQNPKRYFKKQGMKRINRHNIADNPYYQRWLLKKEQAEKKQKKDSEERAKRLIELQKELDKLGNEIHEKYYKDK